MHFSLTARCLCPHHEFHEIELSNAFIFQTEFFQKFPAVVNKYRSHGLQVFYFESEEMIHLSRSVGNLFSNSTGVFIAGVE